MLLGQRIEPLILRSPESPDQWDAYFDLRWRILREPWGQARESERDSLDDSRFISSFLILRVSHWPADACILTPPTSPR